MSTWWDEDKKKYRSSLPYKIFYVWGWPFFQWVMFRFLKPDQAHWFAIHIAIPWVGAIDKAWGIIVLIAVLPLILLVRLLTLLPWFTCEPPKE